MEDARGSGPRAARSSDVLVRDEPKPPRSESIIWLEHFLRTYEGSLLMTRTTRI